MPKPQLITYHAFFNGGYYELELSTEEYNDFTELSHEEQLAFVHENGRIHLDKNIDIDLSDSENVTVSVSRKGSDE